MVDTSSLAGVMAASQPAPGSRERRVRRSAPPATQQPSFLDQMGENFLRGQQAQIRSNAVDNPFNPIPVSSSAFFEGRMPTGGELGTDATNFAVGAALGAGIGAIGKQVGRVINSRQPIDTLIDLDLDPATTARMLAINDRLFHGRKTSKANPAPLSFDVLPQAPSRFQNWFDGDFFTTTSEGLADTYGHRYRISSVPDNLRVLDLMPGGRSIADQNPELAAYLNRVFGPEYHPSELSRHKPYTEGVLYNANDPEAVGSMNDILDRFGYNALRHISGQGAGRGSGLEEPVYVFFNPQGMQAVSDEVGPIARNVNNFVEKFNEPIIRAKNASQRTHYNALQDWEAKEIQNRISFFDDWVNSNPNWPGANYPRPNPNRAINIQPPMPPGYQPLPKPSEPGALDFLKYLFRDGYPR